MHATLRWIPTAALAIALLSSCAGYQLGGRKPEALAGVERIAIPMFANQTQHARAEAIATSALANAISQDGTYRVSSVQDADAILECTITSINYAPMRSSRFDTLLTEQYLNTVNVRWVLRDARNPTRIITQGDGSGASEMFRDNNLQSARHNALNSAMENMADTLVGGIANTF